jgi:signal transduction histidine kinase
MEAAPSTSIANPSDSLLIDELAKIIAQRYERSNDLICKVEYAELAVSHKHLKCIASELIDNAFKFSQAGTPVTICGECRDNRFDLQIGDRRRGMTPEQIERIEAFMQFERSTYEQQGLGLGLKIAQKVVELYGGQLEIASTYQTETTVHLTLPLKNLQAL